MSTMKRLTASEPTAVDAEATIQETALVIEIRLANVRHDRGREPIKFQNTSRNPNFGWMTGAAAAAVMVVICVFAFVYR